MAMEVLADGRPKAPVRVRRLPAGVTETYSKVTLQTIPRPVHGANVYRHIQHDKARFCIDGLDIDEAHRLMILLLDREGMKYIGLDLARAIYPEAEVTQ